ncbi:tabinhibitin 3-like [Uranotaenia lowii]|uniref:tabinhibitin 3-like n=1 Tax=Uranotaenia lowii TaxID=190385 RepID=UPI00247B2D27|nr:tabinhibitin 3-like [Uranotaenia lowii]
MKPLFVVSLLVAFVSSFQPSDYCDPSLCRFGSTHVACNAKLEFANPTGITISLNDTRKARIVQLHNQLRNKIASGKQDYPGGFYPSAARMTKQWDDELAYIAGFNARRCQLGHDKCRATPKYPASGQNLAYYKYIKGKPDMDKVIDTLVNRWYAEYKDANVGHIQKYPEGYQGPQIGHFTEFVQDRNDRVGCALVQWFDSPKTVINLACNYARTNIFGQTVYIAGDVASQCTSGTNPDYPALCRSNELVDYTHAANDERGYQENLPNTFRRDNPRTPTGLNGENRGVQFTQEIVGEAAKIRALSTTVTVRVKNLDEIATNAEVKDAMQDLCIETDQISIRMLERPPKFGTQVAFVKLLVAVANAALKCGRLKVGWSICQIAIPQHPERCFRCVEYGHKSFACKGTDRSGFAVKPAISQLVAPKMQSVSTAVKDTGQAILGSRPSKGDVCHSADQLLQQTRVADLGWQKLGIR